MVLTKTLVSGHQSVQPLTRQPCGRPWCRIRGPGEPARPSMQYDPPWTGKKIRFLSVTKACNVVLHRASRVAALNPRQVGTIIEIHHNGRRAVAPIYAMIRSLCQIRDSAEQRWRVHGSAARQRVFCARVPHLRRLVSAVFQSPLALCMIHLTHSKLEPQGCT